MITDKMPVAFDLEGILVNPAADFAWLVYDNLVSPRTRQKYPRGLIEKFDEYDDTRWERERNRKGHNTGTTPIISLCIAAADGITDDRLIGHAENTTKETPGAKELLAYIRGTNAYIITSTYAVAPVIIASRYGIPFYNVFSNGFQQSATSCKFNPALSEEVRWRSPVSELVAEREELMHFLDRYLINCGRILEAYKNENSVDELLEEQRNLFNVPAKGLSRTLKYLLLDETGIMGAHNKARVLRRLAPNGNIIYLGDSIVDADALDFANYGISMNCTNEHALLASKLNIATIDIGNFIEIYEMIRAGKFAYASGLAGFSTYSPEDIRERSAYVLAANREAKNELKRQYELQGE